jgi:hypothetical protein
MTTIRIVHGIAPVRYFRDRPKSFMPKLLMPKSLKIAFDVLLIVIPLAIIIYFSASPDAFNAFLNWMMRTF